MPIRPERELVSFGMKSTRIGSVSEVRTGAVWARRPRGRVTYEARRGTRSDSPQSRLARAEEALGPVVLVQRVLVHREALGMVPEPGEHPEAGHGGGRRLARRVDADQL